MGRAGREREGERGRAGWGARPVRVASGARGVLGPAQRGGWWRGRAVPSRRRGRGERERRGRRGQARRVGERREEGRGKGKEKKWEKEKKRKRRGEKREKERGGEGSVPGSRHRSRSLSATLGVRARENATHGSRKNRVSDTGVGPLGIREIRRNREDSGRLGLGFQGGISSSTTKQNFSARFTLGNFRNVTNLPHLK